MFGTLDISTSALTAYRTQMDVAAGNIAMKDVTRDENGVSVPFRRRVALLAPGDSASRTQHPGVHVSAIVDDPTPFGLRWDPDHVDAIKEGDKAGYVRTSNVDYQTEMVNAMIAARAYEANVTVMEMSKRLISTSLQLLT
jgi:flagellar basal-body rod protein FlgC